MNARRATIKEPVPVDENPEVTEDKSDDNPEVTADEAAEAGTPDDEDDVPSLDDIVQAELKDIRPGDDTLPEGDIQWDGDEDRNPDEDDPDFLGDAYSIGGDGPEAEADPEPVEWHPGNACLVCGNRTPRLTIGWGNGCDQCLVPDED